MNDWIKRSRGRIQFKQWGEEESTLAFDPISCDTHLLDPLASEVMRLVDESPRSTSEIVSFLGPLIDTTNNLDATALIDSCLQNLHRTGLIERRTNC